MDTTTGITPFLPRIPSNFSSVYPKPCVRQPSLANHRYGPRSAEFCSVTRNRRTPLPNGMYGLRLPPNVRCTAIYLYDRRSLKRLRLRPLKKSRSPLFTHIISTKAFLQVWLAEPTLLEHVCLGNFLKPRRMSVNSHMYIKPTSVHLPGG